jgi:hypothetical protein
MKKYLISLILLLNGLIVFSNTDTINYISNFKITPNYTYKGVQGIYVEYQIDFKELRKKITNDSILELTKFYFNTTLSLNNIKIKPALGFQYLKNYNGNLQYVKKYDDFNFDNENPISEYYFIPYAALDVDSGEYTINVLSSLNGKDAYGDNYIQNVIYKNISIKKPKQYKVTFNIDYLEVETLNTQKQSWDYNIFNNDKPDVSVSFLLANTLIWTDNVRDSYIYAKGPKSKNIQFMVSENDKIRFRVEDVDVVFHDFIAELIIPTPSVLKPQTYTLSKKFGSVKDAYVTWKIE